MSVAYDLSRPWAHDVSSRRSFVASLADDLRRFHTRWFDARFPRRMFTQRGRP